MIRTLKSKLIFQHMVMVLVCMLLIPAAISYLLDWQFRGFAKDRLEDDEQEIVEYLQKIYAEDGSWRSGRMLPKKPDFLRWPMISIRLFDSNGVEVRQFCRTLKLPSGKRPRMERHLKELNDKLIVNTRIIEHDGRTIGTVQFSCMPFSESREGDFLRQFNGIMFYAVGLMLIIAALIAWYMADRISRPVLNAAARALQISRGKYRMETKMESDITELQTLIDSVDRLGESLEAQEELRKRLLSDMAHELRNPVTIIKSHLEAIEDGVWEATPERLRLTVSEVDRLSQLICETEKLTSIEGAGRSMALENADLSAIIEKAAMVFDPLYRNKGVELSRVIESYAVMVIDPAKIRQVVENLLSNALRYTDEGGAVTVSLKASGSSAVIEVADTGIGIEAKDLPYIFERFYRTDLSRARKSGGIGIGLAIVKAIVEAHGGTIKVTSTPGVGSKFTVELPKLADGQGTDTNEV